MPGRQRGGGSYRRILGYALRQKRALASILVLTLVSSGGAVLQPWPLKLLLDYALGEEELPAGLATWGGEPSAFLLVCAAAGASLLVFALNTAVNSGLSLLWTAGGQRMVYDIAADVLDRLQRLSLRYHGSRPVGDSLSRISGDTYCVYGVTEGLLLTPAQSVFTIGVMGAIAWQMDRGLAVLSFAVAPLLALSAAGFGPRLKRRARRQRESRSRLMSFVHQTLSAIPAVQAFGSEPRNRREFERLAGDVVRVAQRGKVLGSSYGLVNGLITAIGTAAVLYVGGLRVLAGALPLGSLLVFLTYLRSMQGAWKSLFGLHGQLKSAEASMDRLFEVLDSDEAVREAPDARPLPAPRHAMGRAVSLEGVTFGYEPQRPVLHDVSLDIRPGETLALVGPTGAGKSTLAALVPRFFDPWEGRVTLDGVDLRRLRIRELRSQVAIVLQEPFLLPLSVEQNVAYGRPSAAREEIEAAAAAANADAFIRSLPEGYDTVIGEGGATLSGGERQRLAIARALLKDAPVLILDEPTSALDAETEAEVMQAFSRLAEGRTTLLIAHRLSTVRRADRIAVLQDGRVVELGSHRDLLARGGLYQRLCAAQDTTAEAVA